jgi:hypothetical protein
MHKLKPYKCSICGAELPDLPMPVLKHQMSHVTRPSVDEEAIDAPADPVSNLGGHTPRGRRLD